jgi:hypothetical protein
MVKKWSFLMVLCLTAPLLITGCSVNRFAENSSFNAYSLVTPPEHQMSTNNYLAESPVVAPSAEKHPQDEAPGYSERVFYSSAETAKDKGCSVRDRFDTTGLLSFYSEDRRKRLSFHTGGFDEAVLRYSFKLPSGKKNDVGFARTNCLRPGAVQGILGSFFKELDGKDKKSAFEELQDKAEERGLDFWH